MQKTIKSRTGREIILPTSAEDAAIKRPMLSMRVDPDVLAQLRASGKGWQTRVNALLRQAVEQGKM